MTYLDCQEIAVAHETKLTPATLWKASSSMSLRRSVKQGSVWNAYSSPELAYHSCFLCCLVVSTAEPRCLYSVPAAFKSKTNLFPWGIWLPYTDAYKDPTCKTFELFSYDTGHTGEFLIRAHPWNDPGKVIAYRRVLLETFDGFTLSCFAPFKPS